MKVLAVVVHHWDQGNHGINLCVPILFLEYTLSLLKFSHFVDYLYTSLLHLEDRSVYRSNSYFRVDIDIKVVTDGSHHVLDYLDPCKHSSMLPLLKPLLCFLVMKPMLLQDCLDNDYDYFCYLEDDLIINDSCFSRNSNHL